MKPFYLNDYCTNDFLRTAAIRVVNIPVNELIEFFFSPFLAVC